LKYQVAFLISWIITGAATLAGAIAGIEIVTKMFLYYLHERGWNKIKWAKQVNEGHTTLLPFYCYFSCFKQYYDAPEHSQIHKKEIGKQCKALFKNVEIFFTD